MLARRSSKLARVKPDRTWTSGLKGRGIRVSVISPGVVVTPAYDALLGKDNVKRFTDQ